MALRLFFALPVTPSVQAVLDDWVRARADGPDDRHWRWTSTANRHLTLCFLGAVDRACLPALDACARRVAAGVAPFRLRWETVGPFPDAERPRFLVAEPAASEPLRALRERLSAALAALGFPREKRRFRPHVTLARRRDAPRPDAVTDDLPAVTGTVDRFGLYTSERTDQGVTYTVLAWFALGAESGADRDGTPREVSA